MGITRLGGSTTCDFIDFTSMQPVNDVWRDAAMGHSSYKELVNYSGSGILHSVSSFMDGTANDYAHFRVTIDGGGAVVYDYGEGVTGEVLSHTFGSSSSYAQLHFHGGLWFKTSLLVEFMQDTGGGVIAEANTLYSTY